MERNTGKRTHNEREVRGQRQKAGGQTCQILRCNRPSVIRGRFSTFRILSRVLLAIALPLLLWLSVGCGKFRAEPTPTMPALTLPVTPATATIVLPTPPPGATLTAMVEAYRRTRTPAGIRTLVAATSPAGESTPTETPQPALTPSPSPSAGPTIHVVPEVSEPGAFVEVRGAGWQPAEEIEVGIGPTIDQAEMTGSLGIARADGTFSATLFVPASLTSMDAVIIAQSLDGQRRAVARLYLVSPTETVPPPPPSPTRPPKPTATPTPKFKGWRGEYYDNVKFKGSPARIRDDSSIDFDWGQSAPMEGVPADAFSVRWTRQIDFPAGGYRFNVEVDDGVRVFIDDQLVLDAWKITSTASYEFQQVLDGPTEIRVEYFDAGGNATIKFMWQYLGRYPNWRAEYYDNSSLSGKPALVRDDIAVDFNWGADRPAPQVPPDNFSVRWTRTVSFDAGTHRFHAQADDGVRVWVNDELIIDEWHTSTGEMDYVADIYLSSGSREIRIEYYEAGGKAEVHVWWENLDAYVGWRGAYYDNRTLSGAPAFVRDDPDIDFDWGKGSPDDVGPDNFSVRWTDRRGFGSATYRFFAEHDDGVRVWVGDQLVIDEWYETGPVTHRGDVELTAGFHEVRVEYFEATGEASIRVWWELTPYR